MFQNIERLLGHLQTSSTHPAKVYISPSTIINDPVLSNRRPATENTEEDAFLFLISNANKIEEILLNPSKTQIKECYKFLRKKAAKSPRPAESEETVLVEQDKQDRENVESPMPESVQKPSKKSKPPMKKLKGLKYSNDEMEVTGAAKSASSNPVRGMKEPSSCSTRRRSAKRSSDNHGESSRKKVKGKDAEITESSPAKKTPTSIAKKAMSPATEKSKSSGTSTSTNIGSTKEKAKKKNRSLSLADNDVSKQTKEQVTEESPIENGKKIKNVKKTKRANKKDPNAPKRPMSTYMLFCQDNRARLKSENPDVNFSEMGKLLGEAYRNLTKENKDNYEKQSAELKTQYEKEKAEYEKENTSAEDDNNESEVPEEESGELENMDKETPMSDKASASKKFGKKSKKRKTGEDDPPAVPVHTEEKETSKNNKKKKTKKKGGDKESQNPESPPAAFNEDTSVDMEENKSKSEKKKKKKGRANADKTQVEEKKKSKKKKKDPNCPKKPTSSYFFFSADMRKTVREDSPNMTVPELGKHLGSEWKKLSTEDKKKYTDLAAADKKRYEKEMEEYNRTKVEAVSVDATV